VVAVVRLADARDASRLARLHRRAAMAGYRDIFPREAPAPTYEELLAQWEQWLGPDRKRGRRAFVADATPEAGARPLGVVLAGPDPMDDDLGHLARLSVEPDEWGRGIGTQLYEAAIEHMVEAGFRAATLWVLEANARARSWYQRLGWRETGERKTVYAPASIDDIRYRLELRP
jgi:ribosomal protein S18 acetylase RimI-like enzyme